MGRKKPPLVEERCRVLNNAGLEWAIIEERLQDQFGIGVMGAPSWETFKRWRKKPGWLPYKTGSSDLPLRMKPDLEANVSGINDAILHLSILAAKRSIPVHDAGSTPIKTIIRAVLWDVHQALEPGAPVLSHLRKWVIRDEIQAYRDSRSTLVFLDDEDPIETIMKEVLGDEE